MVFGFSSYWTPLPQNPTPMEELEDSNIDDDDDGDAAWDTGSQLAGMSSEFEEVFVGLQTAFESSHAGTEGDTEDPGEARAPVQPKRRASRSVDVTVGLPGSPAAEGALLKVESAIREAAGYPGLSPLDGDPLVELATRLDGLMTRLGVRDNGDVLPKRSEGESLTRHIGMRFTAIPTGWYGHVARVRGKGATRSVRAYFEALHILAYIVHMYRRTRRFDGQVLWLNQKAVRALFWLSKSDYEKAVRYLEQEGFITKIVVRGFVPWDARSKGVFLFVVPRVQKLRAISRSPKKVPASRTKPRGGTSSGSASGAGERVDPSDAA